jgi:hypothetical protein
MLLEEERANAKAQAAAANKRDDDVSVDIDMGTNSNENIPLLYECPVYANKFRGKSHLFSIPFPCRTTDHKLERWTVQGIAVILEEK